MIKKLAPNKKFIRNIDEDFIDEFVNVPTGIPKILMNILKDDIPEINIKRMMVFSKHPEYEKFDCKERIIAHSMMKENNTLEEVQDFHIKYAMNFIKEHPQFKEIVKIEL